MKQKGQEEKYRTLFSFDSGKLNWTLTTCWQMMTNDSITVPNLCKQLWAYHGISL
jgi:hypothetical protein